jgi:hypothetical protein
MGVTEVVAGFNLRTLYASYRIGRIYAQTASQHPLPPCAMKPAVLDQCKPLNVHMLALSL